MSKPEFNEETVRKVAGLARLELNETETKKFSSQLGNILDYVAKLNECNTNGIEPLYQALEVETQLRDDVVNNPFTTEQILSCAPEQVYENFKVPQVINSKKTGGGNTAGTPATADDEMMEE